MIRTRFFGWLSWAVGIALLAGCAASDVFEREYRQHFQGTVIGKTALVDQAVGQTQADLEVLAGTVALNLVTVPLGLFVFRAGRAGTKNPVAYDILLDTGRPVRVVNEYSSFSVGECVAVFLSENWEEYPPRMAYGTKHCGN